MGETLSREGVNLRSNPAPIRIIGERALGPLAASFLLVAAGPASHRIQSGETWRAAETLDAPGVNGVLVLAGNVNGARIGPARITRAYRAIESARSNADLSDIRIEHFVATELERDGIRLRGNIDGVVIRDFTLSMRHQPQQAHNLPEGIALLSGKNISISDGHISGFRLASIRGQYPNGDGIAAELSVSGLRIEDVESNDNADAGFDLKSSDTHLDGLTASRNYRNYRFWGEAQAGTLTSIDPRNAHVWAGNGAVVRIEHLVAQSTTDVPLLRIEGAREVEIAFCDLAIPATAPIVVGKSAGVRVKLGPGCDRN